MNHNPEGNFIFYGDVARALLEISEEQERNDFAWRIIKYGAFGELELTGDGFKDGWLKNICMSLDTAKNKYQARVEKGKTIGRKQEYDREELRRLVAAGRKGKDIAKELGVSEAAIYHDEVWKKRVENNFYRE